jgi:DNA-binding NtrC family response regulator
MKQDKIRSIIIIEDNKDINTDQRAKDLGAYAYFNKPFNNSILVNTLNENLRINN